MKKRVFSLLTALILLVTSLQITAFAAPVSDDIHPQYPYSNMATRWRRSRTRT